MALLHNLYFYIALVVALFVGLRLYYSRQRWQAVGQPAAMAGGAAPTAAASATSLPSLVVSPPPPRPAGVALSRQPLRGVGTMELPTGPAWEHEYNAAKDDHVFFNAELEMVVAIRNQHNGMRGHEQAYLDSYNQVSVRDAPNWQRGPEQRGQLAGVSAARTSGEFDNGQAWVTRDYLLFGAANTVILQTRVPAPQAPALALTDYLAATFRPA